MMEPTELFWTIAGFAFVFGALIGSFLNVVIYRVPAELSIVRPASRCPECETPIAFYDNIPIISWFILRGKCRECGTGFSIRYPLVEALTGGLAVAAWYQAARPLLELTVLPDEWMLWAIAVSFLMRFTFLALLVAITFIDLDHYIIPHSLSLPGIVLGLASPWVAMWLWGFPDYLRIWPFVTPVASLVGAIAGFLVVVAIFYGYLALRGIEGIGGGDATLMAMVGAWCGWPALFFVFFAASLQGLAIAGLGILLGNRFVRDSGEIFADGERTDPHDVESDATTAPDDALDDVPEVPARQAPDDELSEPSVAEEDAVAQSGKLAVPFGPFISLAAAEFYLFGPLLPPELSMIYLYY